MPQQNDNNLNCPEELLDYISKNTIPLFGTRRIKHLSCSDNKDACLTVTRLNFGYIWNCFRCGAKGKISVNLSPEQTIKRLQNNINKPVEELIAISLPRDFQKLSNDSNIPFEAQKWIFDAGLTKTEVEKYNFGWSPLYGRVIIPIYGNYFSGDRFDRSLIGWIGREIYTKTKIERQEKNIPKYITQKRKGTGRIYFSITAPIDSLVIVEDILSAIKVHKAVGFNVVALLNKHISVELYNKLRIFKTHIWLDPDAKKEIIKTVQKMRSLGLRCYTVFSYKDPKNHTIDEIINFLKEK